MKYFIHSNAPWSGTGYGVQCDLETRWVAGQGHDVVISGFYGLQGATLNLNKNIRVLPVGHHPYGNDVLIQHYETHKPDIFRTLLDIWVIDDEILKALPIAAQTPVDHDPMPPHVLHKLKLVKYPIAMSRFGERLMKDAGLSPMYLPHAFDAAVYHPMNRDEARKTAGLPEGKFLAVVVAANKGFPSRKNLVQIVKAWSIFIKTHPDSVLYIHTEINGINSGLNMYECCKFYGLTSEHVKFPNMYTLGMGGYPPHYLNLVYNAADVKLSPSAGEGFGVTDLEAQAAGCPVIVTDFSAQAELGEVGYKIPVDSDDLEFTLQSSEQVNVPPSKIVTALEWAYENWKNEALRSKAHEFAQPYEMNTVFSTYLQPIMDHVVCKPTASPEFLAAVAKVESARAKRQQRKELAHAGD